MLLKQLTPVQSLNKAYRKEKVARAEIELFKKNLNGFIASINPKESEEHVKNNVTKFLYDTYYNGKNQINTKGRIDLAIYEDKKPVVIIEAKRPSSPDMVTAKNLNAKAMHELILYYLRERIDEGNIDIKFLVATNMYEWFVFDAAVFDNIFYKNSALTKDYVDWKGGRKTNTTTDFFYAAIAAPFLKNLKEEIAFTWFDFRDVEKAATNNDPKDDKVLKPLYQLLSPAHLLKQPFANDSNSLDTKFYTELLHIIGLEEKKDGGKKLIQRKEKSDAGSLLENTITILISEDRLRKLPREGVDFGKDKEERLFNVALELCITWINRILFLKLLEGQLLNYHGDKHYCFLDFKNIPNYDELNKLFFQVLAKTNKERTAAIREKFQHVPYLNSSLFETSALEDDALRINSLDDSLKLKIANNTVLKTENGKKREGEMTTLQYLFEFLDAYDFTSEGKEEIQEENKSLINASVLGLIFEKINGYKDGSFFTPGFITMYMCRETIRRAVVQKFKETKGWELEGFEQLHNHITPKDIEQANEVINSLKICDPAVGSGHFLVSALNEILTIKSELGVLTDRNGKVLRDYAVEVINDELIVSTGQHEFFEYKPGNKESQRVQEALFHEKQTLIENCLFGVDINPNSVKICRLRLWIELLKNAYYTVDSKYSELETLPNIDINIKQGNSLISRFPLDADLSKALRKSKWTIETYKIAIQNYHRATSKDEKRELEKLIETIKANFETEIANYSDPRKKKIAKLGEQLYKLTGKGKDGTGIMMFEPEASYGKNDANAGKRKKEIAKIETEINKLAAEIDEIKSSVIYRNAFEWRFEFPEVLDKEGNFVGFDLVIGNPPYMRIQELKEFASIYRKFYKSAENGNYDIYVLFVELGLKLLSLKGDLGFILPHKFFIADFGQGIRSILKKNNNLRKVIHFGHEMVFEDASTYTCLLFLTRNQSKNLRYIETSPKNLNGNIDSAIIPINNLPDDGQWILKEGKTQSILEKIGKQPLTFAKVFTSIFSGIQTSADKIYSFAGKKSGRYIVNSSNEFRIEIDFVKLLIKGDDIKKYSPISTDNYVIFPYHLKNSKAIPMSEKFIMKNFPEGHKYLKSFEFELRNRESGKMDNDSWYLYGRSQNLYLSNQPKLVSPDITLGMNVTRENGMVCLKNGAYGILVRDEYRSHENNFLALLNSRLLWYYLQNTGNVLRGGYFRFNTKYIMPFPVPSIDALEGTSISRIVNQIYQAQIQNSNKTILEYEKEIDKLIYQLYGLTKEEIKIVEGK
jgi:adenine-specific DNA-methyltransferase